TPKYTFVEGQAKPPHSTTSSAHSVYKERRYVKTVTFCSYAEFRNMRSVSTQSRRKLFLRLQILRIFSHCGARRSVCRVRETLRVSVSVVPPRPRLQASPLDQPVDRLRSFEYHHAPTTAPPSGYRPWLAAPPWRWCAARREVRRVSFVTTHTL